MGWDEWIELDNQFLHYHDLKAQRIKERGQKCCRTAPEAYDAALELLEELVQYLPARYPDLYQRTDVGMQNLATGESFNILEKPLSEDPMTLAARMVQDDLAIMIEKPDGQYHLLAGAILLAGFWRLEDKFGMGLSEIHTSGDVPGFRERLEKVRHVHLLFQWMGRRGVEMGANYVTTQGMTNFFRRIQPQSPVLRNNYFIQVDDKLAWSESIGSEDAEGIGWFTVSNPGVGGRGWWGA